MSVLSFRPHRLEWEEVSPGVYLANGDYKAGTRAWQGYIECSAVARGEADKVVYADGVERQYSYTITLPARCRDFALGERVRLSLIGGRQEEYSVLGFQRYQHLCKLWV